jgi:hypothetical protein
MVFGKDEPGWTNCVELNCLAIQGNPAQIKNILALTKLDIPIEN